MSLLDELSSETLAPPEGGESFFSATDFDAPPSNSDSGSLPASAAPASSQENDFFSGAAAPAAPLSAPLSAPHSAPLSAAAPLSEKNSSSGLFVAPVASTNDAALRTWRAAHNEKLKKEAADATKRADEELSKAKVELDKMTAEWEAKKKRGLEKNVAEEKKFLADRDAAAGSHGWSNVGRYVDLKGLENTGGDRDVVRMREVLTKLAAKK